MKFEVSKYPAWPNFTAEEVEAVKTVLLSNKVNYWTGNECRKFEDEFAAWCGVKHAITLANGSLALELALRVLGIGNGDEVIVSPRTFIASVACIVNVGATPIFADVDRNSQNISFDSIIQVYSQRTKAIICVHLAGWPCDMDPIMNFARQNDLYVIEDCAQAHGAKYKNKHVGSIGHIGAWSFCQDKIITTGGEGGMVTTNDKKLWQAMWSYKDHGKDFDEVLKNDSRHGFKWVHHKFGTNLRMLEIQAAIGRIQLRRLDGWLEERKRNAYLIWNSLENVKGLRIPTIPVYIGHAAYKCYIFIEVECLKRGWNRDRIMEEIWSHGVPCFAGSCPEVYLEKAFDGTGLRPKNRLPIAKELGETSLMFLVHPGLTSKENLKTTDVVQAVMSLARNEKSRS